MALDADGAVEVKTKASFKELLGKAGAQKCSVSQSSDISKSEGVFYVANGKGRGDFVSTVLSGPGAGTVIKSAMIMDGDTIYTWDDTTKQGMKMSLSGMEKMADGAPKTGTTKTPSAVTAEQFNQTYDYKCEDWKVDASLFATPTSVQFMDMNDMMKNMPTMGGGERTLPASPAANTAPGMPKGMDMSAMCGSCDQAGEQRDACRAALGCK
jgi:hypothetical protein